MEFRELSDFEWGVVRLFLLPGYFEQHNSLTIVIRTEKDIKLLKNTNLN